MGVSNVLNVLLRDEFLFVYMEGVSFGGSTSPLANGKMSGDAGGCGVVGSVGTPQSDDNIPAPLP